MCWKQSLSGASGEDPCVFLEASWRRAVDVSVAWSSSAWLRAQHLHTSAERRVSPVASLSSPELLSDLFTCSPHAAQAERMRGIMGEKRVKYGGRDGG